MSIDVLAPGVLTTVQDSGRYGHTALGIGSAGAMDSVALRLANLLVGNAGDAAALEITLRGPRLRLCHDTLLAITGADIDARCGGVALPAWRPLAVRANSEILFGGMPRGARSYLSVAGGIGGAAVLGSRSADINAGIGARALAAGDELACAPAQSSPLWRQLDRDGGAFSATAWQLDPQPWFDADCARPIRVVAGTHFPQLDNAAQRAFFASDFVIGSASNRVGYRLEGSALALRAPLELISEGVVPGTVQLPAGGTPIVLMAEAPTCGGYPRIAQVIGVDLPRLAQRRPGDLVRFAETSLEDAQTRYLERERALRKIARYVSERRNA
jgi:antagonist of KipI